MAWHLAVNNTREMADNDYNSNEKIENKNKREEP